MVLVVYDGMIIDWLVVVVVGVGEVYVFGVYWIWGIFW